MTDGAGELVIVSLAPIENSEDHSAVRVRCRDSSWTANLPNSTATSSQSGFEKDLKWLVERYPRSDPFEVTVAARISEKLRQYGADLLNALQLQNALRPGMRDSHLLLDVQDIPTAPARFRTVHWEVLEDPRLYVGRSRAISSITVRRVLVPPPTQGLSDKNAGPRPPSGKSASPHPRLPRLLAVTARKPHEHDNPHRLVTLPLLKTLKKLGRSDEFEILRPPTFENLRRRLNQNGAGFYEILHLDVHGSVRDNSPVLHFLKGNAKGEKVTWETDYRSAEEVGVLLGQSGIKTVVLNACESAKETEEASVNLARVLIQKGVDTVVAMAYEVLETAASVFTQAFYYKLFSPPGSTALSAVRFGRQQLLQRKARRTKFGTQVDVDDYFVPTIYQSQCPSTMANGKSEINNELDGADSSVKECAAWIESTGDYEGGLIGREADLLLLEMDLYGSVVHADKNAREFHEGGGAICRLIGEAGVGKSALVDTAVRWWRDTGFIREFVRVDDTNAVVKHLAKRLDIKPTPNLSAFRGLMRRRAKKKANDNGHTSDGLEPAATEKPIVFVIDEESHGERALEQIPMLRKIIVESGNLAILVSRRAESWQKDFALARTLPPLTRDHSIELGAALVNHLANSLEGGLKDTRKMAQPELEAFGNVCKLAFGNPMALRLLAYDFALSELGAEAYLLRLMKGHGITIDHTWLPPAVLNGKEEVAVEEDHRPILPGVPDAAKGGESTSVRELYKFLQAENSALAWMLLPFWFRIPHAELRDLSCWYVESYWEDEDNGRNPNTQFEQQRPREQHRQRSMWNWWGKSPEIDPSSMRASSLMFSKIINFPADLPIDHCPSSREEPASQRDAASPTEQKLAYKDHTYPVHDDGRSEAVNIDNPFAADVDDDDDDDDRDGAAANPFVSKASVDASTSHSSIFSGDTDGDNPFTSDDDSDDGEPITVGPRAEAGNHPAPPTSPFLPALLLQLYGGGPAASWLQDVLQNIRTAAAAAAPDNKPGVGTGSLGPSTLLGLNGAAGMRAPLRFGPSRKREYACVWSGLRRVLKELGRLGFVTPVGVGGGDHDGRQEDQGPGHGDPQYQYYTLHPLVPLLLRCSTAPKHAIARDLARRIYPRFTTYRIKGWPLGELHAHEAWKQGPLRTVGEEFLNFLAAACLALDQPVWEDEVRSGWGDGGGRGGEAFGVGEEVDEGFRERGGQWRGDTQARGQEQEPPPLTDAPPSFAAYSRVAQLMQLTQVLHKGILRDRTRHAVVAAFWEDARQTLVSEAAALKRTDDDDGNDDAKVRSFGSALSLAAGRLRETRETLPDDDLWCAPGGLLLLAAESIVRLAWLAYHTVMLARRFVQLVLFLRNHSAWEVAQSLIALASRLMYSIQAQIVIAARTNSRAPVLSLMSEVVAMLLTCNLCIFYEGVDESRVRFYLAEAKQLARTRTRIPLLDILVARGAAEALELIKGGLRLASERDIQVLLAKRQAMYRGLAHLGHDTGRYLRRDHGVPGVQAAVAAALDLDNSLSAPYEAVLKARAESIEILRRDPGSEGLERAERVLQDALYRELHDHRDADASDEREVDEPEALEDDNDPGRSGRGGAVAHNVAYLYRGLSDVARHGGDWPKALSHWEEAQRWEARGGPRGGSAGLGEKDAGYVAGGVAAGHHGSRTTRSWRRAVGDTATLWGLKVMASLRGP